VICAAPPQDLAAETRISRGGTKSNSSKRGYRLRATHLRAAGAGFWKMHTRSPWASTCLRIASSNSLRLAPGFSASGRHRRRTAWERRRGVHQGRIVAYQTGGKFRNVESFRELERADIGAVRIERLGLKDIPVRSTSIC
jgi:hypothetical protein